MSIFSRYRFILRPLIYIVGRPAYGLLGCINWLVSHGTVDARFHDPARFAWRAQVEALFPAIREEAERLVQFLDHAPRVHDLVPKTELYYSVKEWRQVLLYYNGHRIEDHCALYPNAAKVLDIVPRVALLTFSLLEPHETIAAHTHAYKGFLIFHLGLIVVPGTDCKIRVGNEVQGWEEGKVLVIDPCYDHEVWNRSDFRRVILLCEFSRPDGQGISAFFDRIYTAILTASPVGRKFLGEVFTRASKHRRQVEAAAKETTPAQV